MVKDRSKGRYIPDSIERGILLTVTTNGLEGRDMAVVDIPGVYFSTNMDDEVHMVFRDTLADLMVETDPALY